MFHQQQGPQQFPNPSRPPHHQPNAGQHPNHPNMQGMGFQFPRPNQLPDELESALAIRGSRDVDHRQMDHMNQSNQNQGSAAGMGQHGGYGSQPMLRPADNQPGHQQGVDWSNYPPPSALFAPTQHPPQSSQEGTRLPNWNPPICDSQSPQPRQLLGDGGRAEGQGMYTPESAGSILASFGLSNDDLEVLSHYPDDQLTPDTLPFILRDIQLNKSGKKSSSASSSSYPPNMPPPHTSQSAEVPSLLTVTQTAGKVIDYGHASRGTEEGSTRETFKREQLSKVDKTERRQICLDPKEPSKHGDQDYRRANCEKRKSSRSPARDFAPLPKSHNLDRDYRRVESRRRSSSETRSEASSRRSPSSSSASRQHGGSKKLPTPTMISDFAAMSPKVYPHTCSLCHIQCDQEKDWVSHINTVDHTAACRDLRNRYPEWKPNLPSRSGRYGSRALWDPKDGSLSRSRSRSPASQGRYRREPYVHRPHGRTRSPDRPSRPHLHSEHSLRFERHLSGPHYSQRTAFPYRDSLSDRRRREPSGLGDRSHCGLKRPHEDLSKSYAEAGHGSRHGAPKSAAKSTRPAVKAAKMAVKSQPVKKKKKKVAAPFSQGLSFADRLVYLTGIPADATEQEVTDLVGSFGKINNVILLPCFEDDAEKEQKASVCMMKAEDAKALASAAKLCIREKEITASMAKVPADSLLSEANSKPEAASEQESAGNVSGETDHAASDQGWKVLISGLPHSGWSKADIVQFVQPFGTPSDLILAMDVGKALVSFPDQEVAEEMVKVHSFKPGVFLDTEVKMSVVKQPIGLTTPVALYNLLMQSSEPSESPALVGWKHLVAIRNVPDSPAGSREVLRLMRRFGTVIKSLVVSNMIICEIATISMALSVYKRFLMFPCIIQSNPLFFHRKPDPKAQSKVIPAYCDTPEEKPADNSQAAAEALQEGEQDEAPPERGEEKHEEKGEEKHEEKGEEKHEEKGEEKHEEKGEEKHEEKGEEKHEERGKEKHEEKGEEKHEEKGEEKHEEKGEEKHEEKGEEKHEEKGEEKHEERGKEKHEEKGEEKHEEKGEEKHEEKGEEKHEEKGEEKHEEKGEEKHEEKGEEKHEEKGEEKHEEKGEEKHEEKVEEKHEEKGEERAEETKTEEGNPTVKESRDEEAESSVLVSESGSKPDKSDADDGNVSKGASELDVVDKEAPPAHAPSFSVETAMPDLPKMTQAMVNALLVECRNRIANSLNRKAAPPAGDQGAAKQDKDDTKDQTKKMTEERDEEAKKTDLERKEREAKKEKERREREKERRERKERRDRDRERGEKIRKDFDRREWERKERDRRERRRSHEEKPSGSRSTSRQRLREQRYREEAERRKPDQEKKKKEEEEEEEEEFPFNLTDFVTVDELGDVTDLPDPTVVIETLEGADETPPEEAVSMETSVAQEAQPDEKLPESQAVSEPSAADSLESGSDPPTVEPPPGETEGQPGPPGDPGTTAASSLHAEPASSSAPAAPAPAQSDPNSPAGAEDGGGSVKQDEAQGGEPMEESEQREGDPEPPAVGEQPAVLQTENPETAKDDPTKESVKTALPPYDPMTAVGMEYLVPKTGFFCKVCSRFFTGTKVAEINHCRTLKHYENLQVSGDGLWVGQTLSGLLD
ncbi:zinc finger protein 638-like isoform X2 [Cyprinodon tularosa]|uniref:zinc finger protein 638-like isoform X2 n=1 Tax=Cyprinodon tularosa TaxID=77115 RepID=UPI0018E2753D|nr:zinc finger protein 638-like isoform X2 [Cyprinodon tularosa]